MTDRDQVDRVVTALHEKHPLAPRASIERWVRAGLERYATAAITTYASILVSREVDARLRYLVLDEQTDSAVHAVHV